MKEKKFEFIWANGKATIKETTIIKAAQKLNLKNKKIDLGLLIKVRVNGINTYWDSRQFIKHAKLTAIKMESKK